MKIATIVGARPQFIKSAPFSHSVLKFNKKNEGEYPLIREIIIHTGQHFDADMSDIFFMELGIPKPKYNLGINSGSHGAMTGCMLKKIEGILIKEKPDWVLVYGDTNSTLAGALAAVKLHIPIAHVEAGLRSYNREMPEEINRVITDHCAGMLFCPTKTSVNNLRKEGFANIVNDGELLKENIFEITPSPMVVNVGDTMYDAVLSFSEIARRQSIILGNLGIKEKKYLLATVHRPCNTDVPENLQNILSAFHEIDEPIIFPIHPRTRQCLMNSNLNIKDTKKIKCISPISYFDMLILEQNASAILTDSGGVQKEAYLLGVPCITMRTETEWVETVEAGWNVVVGANKEKIINTLKSFDMMPPRSQLYGDGKAAERMIHILRTHKFKRS